MKDLESSPNHLNNLVKLDFYTFEKRILLTNKDYERRVIDVPNNANK